MPDPRVVRRAPAAILAFLLTVGVAGPAMAAPTNDDVTTPTSVGSLPFTDAISTVEATRDAFAEPPPWCDWEADRTVFYTYTPQADGQLVADTFGSDYDTMLDAYVEDFGFQNIGCNDDWGTGSQSRLTVNAYAGVPILFMASSKFGGQGGNLVFSLDVQPPPDPPANDDIGDAQLMALPFSGEVDTRAATTEAGDPVPSCFTPTGGSAWYRYDASASARLIVNTTGSDFNAISGFAIFSGSPGALTEVGCYDFWGELAIDVEAGTNYYVMVAPIFGQPGGVVSVRADLALEMSVVVDTSTVNTRTGIATVRGTITCSKPAWLNVSATLVQNVARHRLEGSGGLSDICDGPTAFALEISSSSGPFSAGMATLYLYVSATAVGGSDSANFNLDGAGVRLRGVK